MKSRRCKTKISQSVIATASADRSPPSSEAISPKDFPGVHVVEDDFFSVAGNRGHFGGPRNTAIMLCPGVPFA